MSEQLTPEERAWKEFLVDKSGWNHQHFEHWFKIGFRANTINKELYEALEKWQTWWTNFYADNGEQIYTEARAVLDKAKQLKSE